jgi:hypothetical protein
MPQRKRKSQTHRHPIAVQPTATASRKLTRWKLALFAGVPLVLIVALAEVTLRLLGFGGMPPLFVPVLKIGDSTIYQTSNKALWLYFGNQPTNEEHTVGSMVAERVVMPKPADVYRVFMVGESTVEGFPYPPNLCAASFLQQYLQKRMRDRRVEVLNVGITAVASYPLCYVVDEALRMQPDALVIYAGHNEYFGAFGVASSQGVGSRPWEMRATLAVRKTGIYQAMQKMTGEVMRQNGTVGESLERTNLMSRMYAREYLAPDDPLRECAGASLQANLGYSCNAAREKGVPVILCSLASNLRDLQPVRSVPARRRQQPLPQSTQDAFEEAMANGEALLTSAPAAARDQFAKAAQMHPASALAEYLLARALDADHETTSAAEHYVIARDKDAMPWRASSKFNDVLQQIAKDHGAHFCDTARAFADASDGVPGWNLFADHLHPDIVGQALLGWSVLQCMQRDNLVTMQDAANPDPAKDALSLGYNGLIHAQVARRMASLFSAPPLDADKQSARHWKDEATSAVQRLQPFEKEALQKFDTTTPPARGGQNLSFFAGRRALELSMFAPAVSYFRSAQFQAPQFSSQRSIAAYYMYYALARDGRFNNRHKAELEGALQEAQYTQAALHTGRDPLVHAIAGLYALLGDSANAKAWAGKLAKESVDANELAAETKHIKDALVPTS